MAHCRFAERAGFGEVEPFELERLAEFAVNPLKPVALELGVLIIVEIVDADPFIAAL
ncbi:MAG: hypothetical protein H0W71_01680 [Sphingomonas sp.]|nr:hypothetical protein [Sphingomonas sp.]